MADFMKKMELLWGIPIFYVEKMGEIPQSYGTFLEEESPFLCSPQLTGMLVEKCISQELPVVYKDENKVYFICVKGKEGFYLSGPVCTEELTYAQLHRFYKGYHIDVKENKHPLRTSLVRILNFTALISELTEGKKLEAFDLLKANSLVEEEEEPEREDIILEMQMLDDEAYHHTYQEERYVLDCVREGREKDVCQRVGALVESAGTLSSKQMNHFRYLAIVTVTISTREAIAGGVSPAKAYRLSDILINKIDKCTDLESVMEYFRKAPCEFARMVAETKNKKQSSSYTEQCKDYIYKNYHHKIQLEKVAEAIGVSQGHLSRVFRDDTGMSIQDYIQQFRVERAANLLKYSEASLMEISDYVCFHSQSHFGSVFKKYMGMTPGQYRNRYKQKEFRSGKIQE
ncbi:MAG: AraC family transcriptional regulator [Eubacteriales bacterium]|nr:AraC family transcriptional regulator [Eubacteriales bacterium]